MAESARLLERAAAAKRASKAVAFHERFDVPELTRDLAALANSGGGVILIGVRRDGSPSGADVPPLSAGVLHSSIERYTGTDFRDVEVTAVERGGTPVTAIVIGPAHEAPLPYTANGGTAFYARHGAKSVPATQADLRRFIDRRVKELRREWLSGIRQVVTAPRGSEIVAIERTEDEQGEAAIRITTDKSAPLFRAVDWDVTHPYRQKELLQEVNARLPDGAEVNAYDIQSVRRVHEIDDQTRPDFVHRPRFGWFQYSPDFVDWLVAQRERDPAFFSKARRRYYELRH
jgi:Schlafen, AlbA_2